MSETAELPFHASASAEPRPDKGYALLREEIVAQRDRIRGDEGLLGLLGLKPVAANVVEFAPAALARLEQARDRESHARTEIEVLAQANYAAQIDTLASVLDLLQARNNADLARRMDEVARTRFGLVVGSLCMEGFNAPAGWRGLRMGMVGLLLGEGATRMGLASARDELFGPAAGQVKSMALARMSVFAPEHPGVLALGSPDPDGFTRDMGAELIAFLARVVERTAERWPPV